MTRPTFLPTHDTITATPYVYYIAPTHSHISFIHGYGDIIGETGQNDHLTLSQTSFTTVYDFGQGLHLTLDKFSSFITLKDFQNDATGHVTLYNSGYTNTADAMAHLKPDGQGGLMLVPKANGGFLLDFAGDMAVKASQITVHS